MASLFLGVARLVRGEIKHGGNGPCLTEIQIHALLYIKDEQPNMRELAKRLAITPPSTTVLIQSLMAQKLVTRKTNRQDARISQIVITAEGLKLLKKRFDVLSKSIGHILDALPARDRNTLSHLLKRIITAHEA